MIRFAAAVLFASLLVGLPAPAALPDEMAIACPAGVAGDPADATPHAASIACLQWWGLDDAALPPDTRLTRAPAGRLFADLVVNAGTTLRTPAGDAFDDDDGHPDEVSLAHLANAGIVRGDATGAVGPDAPLRRGQLAALVVRVIELLTGESLAAGPVPFADVAASVHRADIAKAYSAGLMLGRSTDVFGVNAVATFGQYATVATRALQLLVDRGVVDPPADTSLPFAVTVVPRAVGDSIPGQRLLMLATLGRDDQPAEGPVTASASADGAAVEEIAAQLIPGTVAELTVLPNPVPQVGDGPDETRVAVVVTATRGTQRQRIVVPVRVTPGEDDRRADAEQHLARWVTWLQATHPELGITSGTRWTPTAVQPHILVVSHYLFFSEQWELGLTWHVMIPPHDWTRIYLRPRGQLAPTLAFELSSVSDAAATPHPIEPPASADR